MCLQIYNTVRMWKWITIQVPSNLIWAPENLRRDRLRSRWINIFYVSTVMILTRTVDVHVNRLVVALRLEKEQLSDHQRSYRVIDLDKERDRKTDRKRLKKGLSENHFRFFRVFPFILTYWTHNTNDSLSKQPWVDVICTLSSALKQKRTYKVAVKFQQH